MTPINNIEDPVRLLDEHPQWLDAVRARVLTRELIELPQTLARFASGTNEHFTEVDQHLDRIDERFVEVESASTGSIASAEVDQRLEQGR